MTQKADSVLPRILIGSGGHARVLLSSLLLSGERLLGFVDPDNARADQLGIPYLGDDEALSSGPETVLLINGVGSVAHIHGRLRVYESFRRRGYSFASVIHPSAIISPETRLAAGVQVMAGAILQTGCILEENSIVNTGARIDHDCIVRAHAHVAPGAVLSGDVTVGSRAHVGVGATVIQGVRIGSDSIVGAGAVVLSDVPESCTVVGVPARRIR